MGDKYDDGVVLILGSNALHATVGSDRLHVPIIRRSTIGSRSFTVSGAAVWNDLPAHVTAAPSLVVFRQRLKTFLFSRSFPGILI